MRDVPPLSSSAPLRRHGAARRGARGRRARLLQAQRPELLPGAAAAAVAAAAAAAAAAFCSSMKPDGGTIVTSVTSPATSGRTFGGSSISLRWIEWFISRPVMSTSIEFGIASAGQRTSIAWVTMLTAPPRFTPGAASAFITWIGMCTRMVAPSPSRMKST